MRVEWKEMYIGDTVSSEAHAKINLRLAVVGRRGDGYHLLDMVNTTLALADTVELTITPPNSPISLTFSDEIEQAGADAGFVEPEKNLAVRAAIRYLRRAGIEASCKIHLTKRIPLGAGLGGGSADAAAVLQLLQEGTGKLSAEELRNLALSLGADVPYLLRGGISRVRGIGEKVERWEAPPGLFVPCVLLCPDQHLATPGVFQAFAASGEGGSGEDRQLDRWEWNKSVEHAAGQLISLIKNDLTRVICEHCPVVGQLLAAFEADSELCAGVTGTGSTVFVLPSTLVADDPAAADLLLQRVGARIAGFGGVRQISTSLLFHSGNPPLS